MDYQGIMTRLRPGSRYLLKDGGGEAYEDILQWLDDKTTQPTQQECDAEWAKMVDERLASKAESDNITAEVDYAKSIIDKLDTAISIWDSRTVEQKQSIIINNFKDILRILKFIIKKL